MKVILLCVLLTHPVLLLDSPVTMLPVAGDTVEAAVKELEVTSGQTLKKQILVTEREPLHCTEECPSLVKLVKENREHLINENLGITRSAAAFIRLLNAARGAKKEEIVKVLKSSKNKEIISQLYDLAGATQTQEAHDAVMKVLHLDFEYDLDQNERYFWALSLGSHPKLSVIKDVLKLSEKEHPSEKLAETLVLTVSAMTNRFRRQPGNSKHKIVSDVQSSLESGISACKSEECKQKYLRAFKNLALEDTIPTLLKYAINGTKKTSVAAMKAIRALPVAMWDDTVKKAAERIYFQVGRRYDSSSRTLSLDILLESSPSKALLRDLLLSLTSTDPAYEVKQYLVQRLRQLGERDLLLNNTVREIVREEKMLNTYHIQAQRGLTTAFTRSFLNHPSLNGSLVSIQEVSSGLLKRGIVDIVIDRAGQSQEIFSLGLFTGGLGSFLSSDEESADPDEPEESATAGMEVTALGVQVRPFVFFSGQGELMGHVWSGTGSEKTPAFQTIALLQDHLEYLPLQTGFIAELSLIGAVSFDLSGQIQLSLWNKNAHSLVEKNAGIALQGLIKVDTSFVRSQVEFNLATEVKLNLVSDIDFYGNLALCLQLKQPDSVVRHNIYKVERIPGSKHRLRKSKYKTIPVPGRTYALNRKNNEMCNKCILDVESFHMSFSLLDFCIEEGHRDTPSLMDRSLFWAGFETHCLCQVLRGAANSGTTLGRIYSSYATASQSHLIQPHLHHWCHTGKNGWLDNGRRLFFPPEVNPKVFPEVDSGVSTELFGVLWCISSLVTGFVDSMDGTCKNLADVKHGN
uniref:Vitellogenin domain-containing protein n=1 Tax=Timema tahoe TaxID=61484 RepID=A0A7R9INS4_9NEOP|nr:unnamed protein product [Timema tahoe]